MNQLSFVERLYLVPYGGGDALRIVRRSDHQCRRGFGLLSERHIHFRHRAGRKIHRARFGISYYSDNRGPIFFLRILVVIQRHAPADRVFAGKIAPRERLVDDDHARRLPIVTRFERATLEHGYLHRLKVIRTDRVVESG